MGDERRKVNEETNRENSLMKILNFRINKNSIENGNK